MLSAQLKEKVREKMCLLCDEVAHFDTTPDKWWVPTAPDGLFQPLKTNDNKESVFLCVYLWQFVHLGTVVSKSFIQRRAKPMPDTWSVALRNAADYPYDAARESVRIYTSEVRQEKVIRHVILRWRSIYNPSISFCVSASFNWTHYTESLAFLQKFQRYPWIPKMRIPNILREVLLRSQIQMMKTNEALQNMYKTSIHVNARVLPASR